MANAENNRPLSRSKVNTNLVDFSKVGGLSNHIKLLREVIIFPLLYGDLYTKFNVKAPRGVLFFGPPGTGKTLIAGALATELSREGNVKVTFYQRKGADVLDKWVGESERKLRKLFNQATKSRPSVIFFDELDGLAPVRSQKNDQVHCSVVATLLALMDGLDNTPGVVVIGATNRIDAIDPALRRPGRFDRELYFPLPSADARKEILQVHTHSWVPKLGPDFFLQMSELTSGWCGADLQALCAEAFLCALKRVCPNLKGVIDKGSKLEAKSIMIREVDFFNARMNLVPTSQRLGNYRTRKLSPFIKPLLQRQLDKINLYIKNILPHFTQPFKKFLIGNKRYAGRVVLKGTNQQGLTVHIIPALLQTLDHIPCFILDIPTLFESNIRNACQNLPSILVLSRVDDWWGLIDNSVQLGLTALLEDLHAGLPLLVIATCNQELPNMLQAYFYNNSSIVMKMEDPTANEREQFFAPLFLDNSEGSAYRVLKLQTSIDRIVDVKQEVDVDINDKTEKPMKGKKHKKKNKFTHKKKQAEPEISKNIENKGKRKLDPKDILPTASKRIKIDENVQNTIGNVKSIRSGSIVETTNHSTGKYYNDVHECPNNLTCLNSRDLIDRNHYPIHGCNHHSCHCNQPLQSIQSDCNYMTLMDFLECSNLLDFEPNNLMARRSGSITTLYKCSNIKQEPTSKTNLPDHDPFQNTDYSNESSEDSSMSALYNLWWRTAHVTSEGLAVGQLELLYDIISACIYLNQHNVNELIPALELTLRKFENFNG